MVESTPSEIPVFPAGDLLSEEPQLETYRHLKQLILLLTCLERLWGSRQDFFAGGNMSIYYSTRQRKSEDVRGPDFFVVLNTERKERKSWVVWEEDGKYPNLILEILSDSTAQTDRGLKKQLYQDIFRTPEYFWFDPYKLEFKGFKLIYRRYEEIEPNEREWLWSEELQLYLGILEEQLRFFTPERELVPTPEEAEVQERQRAEAERQRAENAEAKAERLRQKLLEMGVNPEEFG
ncbi:Uma2 family endonuclease [Microcoleus sp. FACHB-68]|uniref:Uma2 family endonuclease n=1 Tax=Microcoleus sp. FACHB-68 TaxID=2692826 RepID=UPI0016863A37|nr:Uma2 family endonuclease [Microcoleus sp. FACHB-68]MBD1939540.1 Uma2 family endonuclease [Microcoleus sp. FACHB-68]